MSISIDGTPGVRYSESESNPRVIGDGAEIPIFIGVTGNASPTSGIQKFSSYVECCKTVANGGIGTDTSTNLLLATLKDFFEESRKVNSGDVTVPYVYVIDLGTATAESATPWTAAMALAKSKRDVTMEVYVGFKSTETNANIISILNSAVTSIKADNVYGNPRAAYFTVAGATDNQLKKFTSSSETTYIQNSRVGLIAPAKWGKVLAKISVTPYYEEPGYTDFRTIGAGEFNTRTPDECQQLQNAGIIFIRDELAGSEIHPRINLAVSTAFAATEENRPNDCLVHLRRNVDQLVREVYVALFSQIKRNETEVNISFCQTDVDVVVGEKLDLGYMKDGTEITVVEKSDAPFQLKAEGVAIPVNSTLEIDFSMYLDLPGNN